MRYSSCPILFLCQNEFGVTLKVNGFNIGYDTLVFYKKGNTKNKKNINLVSEDLTIKSKEFSSGKGEYCFFLKKDDEIYTPIYTTYIFCEKKDHDFKKIIESIVKPEDANYMLKKLKSISSSVTTYTESLVQIYQNLENKQDYEIKSFCQLINAAERYENAMRLFMNKNSVGNTIIKYDGKFKIHPSNIITDIKIYSIKNGMRTPCTDFSFDSFYIIDLMSQGEIILELIHYEPDKEGCKYLWSVAKENIEFIKQINKNSFSIGHTDIDLKEEDIERIVQEKKKENRDAFMPHLIVKQSMYHDAVIDIEIPEYKLLKAMKKNFYISIREPDQFLDKTFSKRYKITAEKMTLNARAELLAGEIILFIEDENRIIVSPFSRLDLGDMVQYGEMKEYVTKKNAYQTEEYVNEYIEHLRSSLKDGEFLSNLSNVLREQLHDSDISPEKFFYGMLIKAATSTSLVKYSDNLVFFTATEWINQHNIDDKFFKKKPRFINARDVFMFPASDDPYVLIVEKITIENNLEPSIEKTYYESFSSKGIGINVAKGDMFFMYAIDVKTYKRSGFILVNNIGKREYFTNHLELEALAND